MKYGFWQPDFRNVDSLTAKVKGVRQTSDVLTLSRQQAQQSLLPLCIPQHLLILCLKQF